MRLFLGFSKFFLAPPIRPPSLVSTFHEHQMSRSAFGIEENVSSPDLDCQWNHSIIPIGNRRSVVAMQYGPPATRIASWKGVVSYERCVCLNFNVIILAGFCASCSLQT